MLIDNSYPESFSNSQTAPLKLIHDSSISGLEKIDFDIVQAAVRSYGSQVGSLRLLSRGINPEAINPIHGWGDVLSHGHHRRRT